MSSSQTQTPSRARPAIGWAGGKTRLLKHLLPLLPEHVAYCEVFGGGLALFCAKPPGETEIINDINGDLVSFYRCCKYHLDPLLDELDLVLNSRQDFEDYCRQLGLTEIQRAARWFIRNKLSFGGQGTSYAIPCRHHHARHQCTHRKTQRRRRAPAPIRCRYPGDGIGIAIPCKVPWTCLIWLRRCQSTIRCYLP